MELADFFSSSDLTYPMLDPVKVHHFGSLFACQKRNFKCAGSALILAKSLRRPPWGCNAKQLVLRWDGTGGHGYVSDRKEQGLGTGVEMWRCLMLSEDFRVSCQSQMTGTANSNCKTRMILPGNTFGWEIHVSCWEITNE